MLCIGCGKNSHELSQLADQSIRQKNYPIAVQYLEKAVGKAPSDAERARLSARLETARDLRRSKESYEAALSSFGKKQFSSAYESFADVARCSEYYSEASAKKLKCGEFLSTEALREAASAYNQGSVISAISTLRKAKIYGSPSVAEMLSRYKNEGRVILLRKASRLYATGSYSEAITVLNLAEELGSREATHLLPRYEAARERQEMAEQERQARVALQQEKEHAKYYEGDGNVQIAVYGVKLSRETDSHVANANSTFVHVGISAKNVGDDIVHVNPNDFTLADSNGNTASHDSDTYSLGNYFDAVDLRPGQSTSGWLIFCMLKDKKYTLGYQGFGGSAEKAAIP